MACWTLEERRPTVPDEKKTFEFEIGPMAGMAIFVLAILAFALRACGHA